MENQYTSLTQNQKLLWLGQELNPESPMYNMVMTYEIKETVSFPHFKTAFQKLVEKSDTLRSVFELQNGELIQRYLPSIDYEIEFKDFSSENTPKQEYKVWEEQRVRHQFDIQKCLFDCVLVKLSADHFIWYINQHHLITDGWSTAIIFSKMSELYAKAIQNEIDELEEFPSYQKFVAFEQKIRESEKGKEVSKYWEERRKKFPAAPSLYHKKNTSLQTASERLHVNLGKERSEKIRELANQKGVRGWSLDLTLYNIFLTTLFAYLHRVTDQEQVLIGSPTHNRTSKSFKNTIGFFVEVFPLLTQIEGGETLMSLLQKVQIESNSFLKNAQTGASTSDLNRNFNVFFNYINAVNSEFNGSPVRTEWVHPGHQDPRHHLRLHVHDFDNSGDIQLYFDFNTTVFDSQEQAIAIQHFLNVLDAFIEDRNQEVKNINLITESEVSRITAWNATTVAYPENETLLSKFEEQVVKTPNEVALLFKEELLSYKALDERSNQVAHFLIQQGIQKNDIIALSLERSLEMMIYIYGIIKAGGAYLPIDINTPTERLNFIVKDAKVKALFYNHNNIEISTLESANCFNLATIKSEVLSGAITKNQIEIAPDDLAYVLYTSGSTGEPKGVKCHHKGICNRLNWMNNEYPITQNDTLLQKTPITFDVSLWELFWPLQVGARLVVEIPDGHKNPERLIDTIQRNKVTAIHFVPSMLNIFSQVESVENCKSLQRIFCSGEALSTSVVQQTYAKLDAEIHNLYGPTEASVDVTNWHCKKDELLDEIPIGKPVANTQLYILDETLNLLPIGVIGELYIAGKQVADGYLNRERLTKERFVKDVFSSDPSATMYKTGDLARYRTDGVIEYHGRIDNQIKIRGLRIELGEIEKTIEKHSNISQAIVKVDQQENLIAYYTGKKVEEGEIINLLKQRLPIHMIPSLFMHLENFEFLSSGKVDRKKLPEHSIKEIRSEKTYLAPRNEIEEMILDIWKEVLQLNEIGVDENFIQIGGNSLSAISITSRLKKTLALEISITDVFNYATVIEYAKYVEEIITELLSES